MGLKIGPKGVSGRDAWRAGSGGEWNEYVNQNGHVFHGPLAKKLTATTIDTTAAVTLTAAQVLGGLILRNTNGASRSDVFPTAALLRAAVPDAKVGTTLMLIIRNTAAGIETITMTAGTGITISGTATIGQNNTKIFLLVFTNVTPGSEAVTAYSVMTGVH